VISKTAIHPTRPFQDYFIVNSSVLFDLGHIEQVVLDKTDTLTSGKMRVAELSSYLKCYDVPQSRILDLVQDCFDNPDKYHYEDEEDNLQESELYSEKSQE
jgi:magnesium-transporting ATPase (P-type)